MGKFCHMATSTSSSRDTKKINKYWLSSIELVLTHTISELGMFGISRKLLAPYVTLCKKFKKNLKFTAQGLNKTQSTIIWLIETLRVKIRASKYYVSKFVICASLQNYYMQLCNLPLSLCVNL